MKRDIIQLFIDWKHRKRRKPLIVRGARQVGKTFAIQEFAKNHFKNIVTINLEETPQLKNVFKSNSPGQIIQELSVLKKTVISPGETLLFIDEIQASPEAIVCLRYFYEQLPELHVMAAGSLLDHTLSELKLSMPVGRVEFCYMFPMSFREFLQALSEDQLLHYIDEYSFSDDFSQAIHLKLLEYLRYYFFIGGMPEAVNVFIENRQFLETERIQSSILTSLQYDFAKYGSRAEQKYLIEVLNYTGQNTGKKIKYVNIDRETRSVNLKDAFYKLEKSRVITLVKHTSAAGVPLSAYLNPEIFKAYFLDIGLANHLCHIQLLDPVKILTINEGAMAEQFAAQELLTFSGNFDDPELFYWTREARNSNAEVDFIFQHKNQIYPIEVKAGKSGTLKSLYVYLYEKKLLTGIRFNIDLPSTGHFKQIVRTGRHSEEIAVNLISLPLYMISQLPRLLDQLPNNEAGRFDDLMI